MGRHKSFTSEQELAICEMYEQVERGRIVAEAFGTSDQTVYRILRKHGIPRTHRHQKQPKQPKNYWDDSITPIAVEMYLDGITCKEIGKKYGYSYMTVYKRLKGAGVIGDATPRLPRAIQDEICRLYESGMPNSEIAKQFGICSQNVSKVAKRNGCKMRGKGSGAGGAAYAVKMRIEGAMKFDAISDVVELLEYFDCEHATVRCKKCGTEFNWCRESWNSQEPCPGCREHQREQARAERERKQHEQQQQREAAREWRMSVPFICKECGEPFYAEYDGAAYCCEACRRKAKNRRDATRKRKRTGRGGGYKHRMRIPITTYNYDRSVTLDAVYRKYRGICCNCGRKTFRTKRHDPLQATLDHIIALGNNGTHTWDNVQLLCSECNSYKRDLGQMRLAIA